MGVRVGRLTRRPEYLRVAATRRRAVTSTLILQMAESWLGPEAPARIGFTTSKKAVGNAVHRNRARRRLKAAAQMILPAHAAPGRDFVAVARETAFDAPFARITADFTHALKKLGAWVEGTPPPPSEMGEGRGGGDARSTVDLRDQPPPNLPHPGGRGRSKEGSDGGQKCPA